MLGRTRRELRGLEARIRPIAADLSLDTDLAALRESRCCTLIYPEEIATNANFNDILQVYRANPDLLERGVA